MKISINGYKRDSLDNKESSLMINSNTLTMKGVDRPITAIPIIDGKPDYSQKVDLNPGDPDYTNPKASGFLEIPVVQKGGLFSRMYDNYQYSPITTDNRLFSQINPRFDANQLGGLPTLGSDTPPNTIKGYNGNAYTQNGFGQWQDQSGNYITPSSVIGSDDKGNFTQQQSFQNDYEKPTPPPFDWSFLNNFTKKRGLQDSLVTAGQSFGFNADNINASPQAKRTAKGANLVRGISALGNAVIEGGASFMEGMGQANLNNEALAKYQEDMRKALTKQRTIQTHKEGGTFYMQEGGQVKDEMLLTEGYTGGIPQGSPQLPNAELERGEFTIDPQTGQTMQVIGKKHSEGGEEMALKDGTKVVSDFIKIGSELSRSLKKDFGITVTPKTTFAKAVEKYRNSIGLTKKLDEQTKIIGKIKDQEEVENQNVRDLNLGHLTDKYHALEQEKTPLDEKMTMFTEMMFELQEQNKAEEDRNQIDSKLKKGGILKTFQEGGQLDENQTTMLINTFCDVTGEDPIEVENMYNQLSNEDKLEAQQSMLSVIQQEQAPQQGGVPQEGQVMQEGGEAQQDPTMQIIQGFAQANGVSPDEIVAQLQQMDEQGQQEALQQMAQSLQGQGEQPLQEQGQLEILFQQFASLNSIPVEQVVQEFQALEPQQQEEAVMVMQEAVSQSSSGEQQVMKKGGTLTQYAEGGEDPKKPVLDFDNSTDFLNSLRDYRNEPDYAYNNVEGETKRLKVFASQVGTNIDEFDLTTRDGRDRAAGKIQRDAIKKNPEVIAHYTTNKPLTKADIDFTISSGLVDRKFYTDQGIKFGKNGKALKGTMESGMTAENALKISEKLSPILNKKGNEGKKADFISKFADDKWYYRFNDTKKVGFKSQEEADAFTKDYTDVGNGTFYSNKTGLYFKPEIVNESVASLDGENKKSAEQFKPFEGTTKPNVNLGNGYFDQSMSPPSGIFFGSAQRVEAPNLRSVNVSYAPQVTEANRQATTAFDSTSMMPDSQRRAVESNIVGQTQMVNNQAIAQTQAQNDAINSQIERYNDVAIGETDKLNVQAFANYEDRFLRAKAAEEADILGWQDYNRKLEAQKIRNEENRNLYNTYSDNFQLTSDNKIILDPNNKVQFGSFLKKYGLSEDSSTKKKQDGGYVRTYLENLYKKKN